MKKKQKRALAAAIVCMALFGILLASLDLFDVRPVGPQNSSVGLATLNNAAKQCFGKTLGFYNPDDFSSYNHALYQVTGILGYLAIATAPIFALAALLQLIRRKSLVRVDWDFYLLAVFYVVVGAVYVLFEKCVINYRPVDLGQGLEPSFPSSHTMLAVALLGAAMAQIRHRVKKAPLRALAEFACLILMAAIVVGRLLCGVHWLTDILGALLLGAALAFFYQTMEIRLRRRQHQYRKARK